MNMWIGERIKKIRIDLEEIENDWIKNSHLSIFPLLEKNNLDPTIFPFVKYCLHYDIGSETKTEEMRTAYEQYCFVCNLTPLPCKSMATELRLTLTYLYSHRNGIWTVRNTKVSWQDIKLEKI